MHQIFFTMRFDSSFGFSKRCIQRTSVSERSDDTLIQSSSAPAEALGAQAHDSSGKVPQSYSATDITALLIHCVQRFSNSPLSPPPLTTSIAPAKDWSERATPRAQTRQEFEEAERRMHASHLDSKSESIFPASWAAPLTYDNPRYTRRG